MQEFQKDSILRESTDDRWEDIERWYEKHKALEKYLEHTQQIQKNY